MNTIKEYQKRFNQLLESTMGNVKPLIMEQPSGTTPPEEDPFKSAMSNFATDMQKKMGEQNVNNRVGSENYAALSKIATDNGMTLSNESDSTYWKWTKDLGGGNQLVFIILNKEYEPRYGGVTSYVDMDGGKYLKAESGKLVKTGEGSMGTYPMFNDIYQIGLLVNNENIAKQQDLLTKLQTDLKNQENMFKSSKKETTAQQGTAQAQPTTTTGTIAKLEKGKNLYSYYTIDKNKKTLTYQYGGVRNDVNTTVTIDSWNFTDDKTEQTVYVKEINDKKVTLSNTTGDAVVTINE